MRKNRIKTKNRKKQVAIHKANKQEWLLIGMVLLITFILFSPALKNEFTNWDDDLYVTENPAITNLSLKEFSKFSDNYVGNFHPLTMISLAIDYHFFKLNPFWYHLKNIIFHLLNTFLVFLFIKKISRNNLFISITTALFFAIHPMHVESVAWVAERKDVLYTFYFLIGLLLYYEYLEKKKILILFAAAAAFVLSALAKSAAVVFPVVLFLIDYYENRKFTLKSIGEKIPLLAFSVYIGMIAINTQSQSNALGEFQVFSLFERIRFASYGFMNYLIKFIYPHHLSSFHPYPENNTISTIYNVALIATLLLLGFFIVKGRKIKTLVFGIGFYLITIALVLQFLSVGNAIIAERYTYVPYIGIGFIYAKFLYSVFYEKKNKNLQYLIGGLVVIQFLFFSYTTYNRTKVWRNTISLWTDVIEKYPNESGAYSNRGHFYRTQNNYDSALQDYNMAIKLDDKNDKAFSNRGKVWFDQGDYNKALLDYSKSIEINSSDARTYANRGAAYGMLQQFENALVDLNKAIELEPGNTNALKNRGIIFFSLKEYEKNIDDYRKYLEIIPDDADIINAIGLCYNQLKEYQKAIDEFNLSIQIDAGKGPYFANRSVAFNAVGDKQNALKDALKAQQLGYNINPEYINFLKQ